MTRWNALSLILVASLLAACAPRAEQASAPAAQAILPAAPPATCPVTQQPKPTFVPPSPYSPLPYASEFWHGNEKLWTALPSDGAWSALPHDAAGYTQKLFWWRAGYDWQTEPEPALTVTGRRLDATAPPLAASAATNGFNPDTQSFMLVGGVFPTAGCWEVTGTYGADQLTYVIWVAP